MPATPHIERHFTGSQTVRDVVIGMADGLTVPFALAAGLSALELGTTAIDANNGVRPWIEHFYLAHGVGTDSAEMPLIGTDLGEQFDERLIMQPGMVLVFEPVIWEEGFAGYRSEDIVAVTDMGWVKLSGSTYEPYGLTA